MLTVTLILSQLQLLVKKKLAILIGELKNDLEEQDIQVEQVLDIVQTFCDPDEYDSKDIQNAESIPDLLYELQDRRYISIFCTQILEQIIETFCLSNCQKLLENYYKSHLVPYLRKCQDNSFESLQKFDQNKSMGGNNLKLVVLNLGEEWNRLSEKSTRMAKKHIALLLDIDVSILCIHGGATYCHTTWKQMKLKSPEAVVQIKHDSGSTESSHGKKQESQNDTKHLKGSVSYGLKSTRNFLPL